MVTEEQADYEPVTRGLTTRWQPGQSGNPKGRPHKGDTFLDILAKRVGERKVQLAKATVDQAEAGNIRALVFIRDSLFGMPAQRMSISVEDSPLEQLMNSWRAAEQIVEADYALLLPDSPPETTADDVSSPPKRKRKPNA